MLVLPLKNPVKVPALMESIEVGRGPSLLAWILEYKHRRHISLTH